jgi:hypothetical protein
MRGSLLLASVVLCAVTSTADAAWSPPRAISQKTDTVDTRIGVAFAPDGRGLVSWTFASDPLHPNLQAGTTALFGIGAGGAIGTRHDAVRPLRAEPVLFGKGEYALLRGRGSCDDPYGCNIDGSDVDVTLSLALGRVPSAPGRAREVDRFRSAGDIDLAGNAKGLLTVAWTELRGKRGGIVWLAVREPGRRLGRPLALDRGSVGPPVVAVGERGAILVAYRHGGRLIARLRRPGHRFGKREVLGPPVPNLSHLTATVTPQGRSVIASFSSQTIPMQGIPDSMIAVRVNTRSPGATRFGGTRLLQQQRVVSERGGPLLAAADDRGVTTLAWNDNTGAVFQRIAADGATQPAQRPGLRQVQDIAARPGGGVIATGMGAIVYKTPPIGENATIVEAAVSGPDGVFGPDELIGLAPGGASTAVAVDPRSGRATAAWLGEISPGSIRATYMTTRTP